MGSLGSAAQAISSVAGLPENVSLMSDTLSTSSAWLTLLLGQVDWLLVVPGAALYVFGFCIPAAIYHWMRQRAGLPSGAFRLPGMFWLAGGAALAIAFGQILLSNQVVQLFWFFFILAAGLPPLAALGLAAQRLGPLTTWRRVTAGIVSGSLFSTHLTILLSASSLSRSFCWSCR